MAGIHDLNTTIIRCKKCPRLVRWREAVAKKPPRRYQGQTYWARPLAGFGDPEAALLIVGLAPAANGGNRTGRIFTGDESGNWLYEALYEFGFSNQPDSVRRDDGLRLKNCYITAAVRCAPPANKPARDEFERCRPYLVQELKLFKNVRVVLALGKIAFDSFLKAYQEHGGSIPKPRPQFRHGGLVQLGPDLTLIASYHPSQQNTFTGKLTKKMFHEVFKKAQKLLAFSHQPGARL
ncbi:MAG: uracil-DNA glycosylase [Deltaproteobacteria bacterium RIFCSPHIGHO2_02_FULL_60_17]|nr:MAG: uracil-DNA glycosylase [Deltaproteobacteria bacterium RIFCSPHIGHO2_02_FULL_60_17]